MKLNIVFQDNASIIKLEENGIASLMKRTRHFNIKMFYITDLIKNDLITIEYCPTKIMLADYITKL